MNFRGVLTGDILFVKLAFSIYSILDILVEVESVGNGEIIAKWDDIEDMKECRLVFDIETGIAKMMPKKYNKSTCWIMRYNSDRPGEFR